MKTVKSKNDENAKMLENHKISIKEFCLIFTKNKY